MQTNSNISYTGLVEKYVGTAYDKMAELHANLSALLLIAGSIEDGSFDEVAAIADELQTVIDKIDEFNSIYYGALPNAPLLDPNGDKITEGDLYYDTTMSLMYVFVRDMWIPLGAIDQRVIYRKLDQSMDKGDHFLVDLGYDPEGKPYTYIPGNNNMSLHLNGELLVAKHITPDGRYTEIDDTTVKIWVTDPANPDVEVGHQCIFHIGTEAATVTHVGRVEQLQYTTESTSETVIYIPEDYTYMRGVHNLTVHIKVNDGTERELQIAGVDYVESAPNHVTFDAPLKKETEVTFTIGSIVTNDDEHFQIIMAVGTPEEMQYNEGQLWFKTDTGRMYILYFDDVPDAQPPEGQPWTNRQWISITPEDTVIGQNYEAIPDAPSPVIHGTIFQDTAPDPTKHAEGTLWFNIKTGNLHIKYQDLDSQQWVKVSV